MASDFNAAQYMEQNSRVFHRSR